MIGRLRRLYSPPEWTVLEQVRSGTGAAREDLRIADALAVRTLGKAYDPLEIEGFELKVSRADWLAEQRHPEKCEPIRRFCKRWYLVVPAPWKNILLSTSLELPEGWGLIELGTGIPSVIATAEERNPAEPTVDFIRALFRASSHEPMDVARGELGPMVQVTRPALSRSHVGLACGHVAPRPLAKAQPLKLPCGGCAEGRPTDREMVEAILGEASPEERRLYLERLGAGQ